MKHLFIVGAIIALSVSVVSAAPPKGKSKKHSSTETKMEAPAAETKAAEPASTTDGGDKMAMHECTEACKKDPSKCPMNGKDTAEHKCTADCEKEGSSCPHHKKEDKK